MKNIKSVEEFREKYLSTIYRSDDIVLVKSNILSIENIPMQLSTFNGIFWTANKLSDNKYFYHITNGEIVRKLSDKEVEDLKIRIESEKYNL